MEAGVVLDRDTNSIPHDADGNAVFTFGVAAMDLAVPALISFTTVSSYYTSYACVQVLTLAVYNIFTRSLFLCLTLTITLQSFNLTLLT